MKKILFSLIAFTVTTQLTAQTKIGGTPGPAQSGAFLELDGSAANKGLLLSRYNTAQMNAIPVTASSNGMLVYNTDSNCVCQYKGTTLGWRSMCNNLKGTTCLPEIINTATASTPLTVPNTFVNLGTINYTATDTTTLLVHWTGSVGYTGYNVDGMNVPMRILMNGTQIASTYFDDASTFVVDDAGSVQVAVKLNPGTYAFVLQAARGGANSGTAQIRPSVFQAIAFPACGGGLTVNEAGGIFWKLTGNAGTDSATNFIGTTDSKPLVIKTNSQPRMIVGSNGNVGIGTGTPTIKLEINNGTVNGAIKIVDGTQGEGKYLVSDANGVGTWVYTSAPIVIEATPGPVTAVNTVGNSFTNTGANAVVTIAGYYILSPRLITDKLPMGCGNYLAYNLFKSSTTSGVDAAIPVQDAHVPSGGALYDFAYTSNIVYLTPGTYYLWIRTGGGCTTYDTRSGVAQNSFSLTLLK
jgi:hypothetical protein